LRSLAAESLASLPEASFAARAFGSNFKEARFAKSLITLRFWAENGIFNSARRLLYGA
jgi:hypothetical protein